MKDLMSSNIYKFNKEVVICGACLENMDKKSIFKIKENVKKYFHCLFRKYTYEYDST